MAKRKKKKKGYTTVRLPQAAWDVLAETLEMDIQSDSFERKLRIQIWRAFRSVELVGTEEIPMAKLREMHAPEYAGYGHGGEGPKEWSPRETWVTLSVPEEAWDVITETLTLDADSSGFDEDLRERISEALDVMVEE